LILLLKSSQDYDCYQGCNECKIWLR